MARMGAAVAGPTQDTRVWSAIGVVKGEPFLDPDEGIFAVVEIQPEQYRVCARMSAVYSGDGFGIWTPLRDGEQVVLGLPMGDTFGFPIILGRVPSRDEKPPQEFQNDRVLIKGRGGEHIVLATQGSGEVRVVDPTGPKHGVRWEDLNSALQSYVLAVNTHTHIFPTGGSQPTTPPVVPTTLNLTPARSTRFKVA